MKKIFSFLLLLFFCMGVHAAGLGYTLTHVWSDSTGTALLHRWRADGGVSVGEHRISADARVLWLDSTVGYFDTSFVKGDFRAEYTNRVFGFSADAGFCAADSVSVSAGHTYAQEAVSGFNGAFSVPFTVKGAEICPYFRFCTAGAEKGDFYWFYGNAEIPYAGQYGIRGAYKNHEWDGSFLAGTLRILNNESDRLVDAAFNLFLCTYRQIWSAGRSTFSPYIGGAFFFGDFTGALTDKNQQYFLYPYKYYNVSGKADGAAVLCGLRFEYQRNAFSFSADMNSIVFVRQSGSYDARWRYKKNIFFDGTAGTESGNLDFLNAAGLASVDCKGVYAVQCKKLRFDVFLSKNWLIPFRFSSGGGGSDGGGSAESGGIAGDIVFSWLFSGISAGVSFCM